MPKKKSTISSDKIQSDKIVQFNASSDVLNDIAEELIDEGDMEGALATFLKIDESEIDYNILKTMADLYTELGMYDYAVNYWYKFLDAAPTRFRAEAYNGLGGNYYMMHNDNLAAFYFNLQITDKNDSEFPFDEFMYDLFDKKDPLLFKQPSIRLYNSQNEKDAKKVEEAHIILQADPDKAKKIYKTIKEDSSYYAEACFYLGVLNMLDLNLSESLEKMLIAKKLKFREDVSTTYVYGLSFYLNKDDIKESSLSDMKRGMSDFNAAMAFFPLYAGFERADIAYEYARTIDDVFSKFGKMHLYYAYAAYNAKKYDDATKHFHNFYNITKSPWVWDVKEYCDSVLCGAQKFFPFEYVEKLQDFSADTQIYCIQDLMRHKPSEVRYLTTGIAYEFEPCLYSTSIELCAAVLQILGIINDEESIKILKNFLLRDDAADRLKPLALSLLVESGNEEETGMVFNHIYSKVPFERVEFNDECGNLFRSAYALAFGRLAPYFENEIYKLRISAYSIYEKFLASGKIRKVKNVSALAALMTKLSGIDISSELVEVFKYLGATSTAVNNLEKLLSE